MLSTPPPPQTFKEVLGKLDMKDPRSTAVREHLKGEEDTAKVAKVVRVVKIKKTEGAITKKKNSLVEQELNVKKTLKSKECKEIYSGAQQTRRWQRTRGRRTLSAIRTKQKCVEQHTN